MTTSRIKRSPPSTKDLSEQLCELILSDRPRGAVYNGVLAMDVSHVEALRAIRLVRTEATKRRSDLQAQIDKLRALQSEDARFEVRCDEIAEDILKEQRELNGPQTPTGMYKVDLNDETFVALVVSPSEACEVDAAAVAKLPNELVKVEVSPRLDLIKAMLKVGKEFEGCRLIVKKWNTDPPANATVQWKKT